MQRGKRLEKTTRSQREPGEPWVGSVRCNPGPDAEERLRRLFTLLFSLATEAKERRSRTGSGPENGLEGDGR